MHPPVYLYVGASLLRTLCIGKRVLEIGSCDVNGSVRPLFAGAEEYVGIDVCEGNGVDVVCDAKDYDGQGRFDFCVCTEVLEHAPEPQAIVDCARRALKENGMLILTCAATGRPPHSVNGVTTPMHGEHYENITPEALAGYLREWDHTIEHDTEAHDLRAVAFKRSGLDNA